MLATGGIGHLYDVTTNPPQACFAGLAMAARAGAVIADAEFVQFHPTAIDIGRDPAPLATEALRGEGATLINRAWRAFHARLHKDGELAPRDIVARGVFAEIAAVHGAFLDAPRRSARRSRRSFPTVYATCQAAGVDPAEPIPVAPAEHYHMGGFGRQTRPTSLTGLWAAGEIASTGVHGANRLASNSLLEAAVFGARAAERRSAPSWANMRAAGGRDENAGRGPAGAWRAGVPNLNAPSDIARNLASLMTAKGRRHSRRKRAARGL